MKEPLGTRRGAASGRSASLRRLHVRVSFLVPAFNEQATIVDVLDRIEALGLDRQVIVDDGSTDDTGTRVAEWQSRHATSCSSARRMRARARRSAPRSPTSTGTSR